MGSYKSFVRVAGLIISVLLWISPAKSQDRASTPAGQVRVLPKILSEPDLSVPAAALQAGHHGTVILKGEIGVDGHLLNLVVQQSSRSEILDGAALAEASTWSFSPAVGSDGNPISYAATLPITYDSAAGGRLSSYSCVQLVRDSDWSDATFGQEFHTKRKAYLMLSGMVAAALIPEGKLDALPPFEERWRAAIGTCRKKPKMRVMEVILGR